MKTFRAKIYKKGINPCVDVPLRITSKMQATKGYIRVKGKIGEHFFRQTLVPIKNVGYLLYVNAPMLKGSNSKVGETVRFSIEQDMETPKIKWPAGFKEKLIRNKVYVDFMKLTSGRRKEIFAYLNFLKTEEALQRNIDKIIGKMKTS